jgi:hypothetical protein
MFAEENVENSRLYLVCRQGRAELALYRALSSRGSAAIALYPEVEEELHLRSRKSCEL